jgi:hypothetical protein
MFHKLYHGFKYEIVISFKLVHLASMSFVLLFIDISPGAGDILTRCDGTYIYIYK